MSITRISQTIAAKSCQFKEPLICFSRKILFDHVFNHSANIHFPVAQTVFFIDCDGDTVMNNLTGTKMPHVSQVFSNSIPTFNNIDPVSNCVVYQSDEICETLDVQIERYNVDTGVVILPINAKLITEEMFEVYFEDFVL